MQDSIRAAELTKLLKQAISIAEQDVANKPTAMALKDVLADIILRNVKDENVIFKQKADAADLTQNDQNTVKQEFIVELNGDAVGATNQEVEDKVSTLNADSGDVGQITLGSCCHAYHHYHRELTNNVAAWWANAYGVTKLVCALTLSNVLIITAGQIIVSLESPNEQAIRGEINAITTTYNFTNIKGKHLLRYLQDSGYCANIPGISGGASWTPQGGAYFAMTLFSTIGYGNFAPLTTTGQAATCIIAIFGIGIYGSWIGIASSVFEGWNNRLYELLKLNPGPIACFVVAVLELFTFIVVVSGVYTGTIISDLEVNGISGEPLGYEFQMTFYMLFITFTTVGLGDYFPVMSSWAAFWWWSTMTHIGTALAGNAVATLVVYVSYEMGDDPEEDVQEEAQEKDCHVTKGALEMDSATLQHHEGTIIHKGTPLALNLSLSP